jgi:hypothetical protein
MGHISFWCILIMMLTGRRRKYCRENSEGLLPTVPRDVPTVPRDVPTVPRDVPTVPRDVPTVVPISEST